MVLIGVNTWSWYIPTTKSNFFRFFDKNNASAECGPKTLIFCFFNFLIAGFIIFSSSENFSLEKQCGFRPVIAILIFFLKYFL